MRQTFILTFFILLTSLSVFAQKPVLLTGSVRDSTKKVIENALIELVSGTDTMRTTSNAEGTFFFRLSKAVKLSISVSCLGYSSKAMLVTPTSNSKEISLDDIILIPVAQQLKEVIVRREQDVIFKRDTIDYNAAAFRFEEGDMVDKMLKQVPGLEIDVNGNVTFEGKPLTYLKVNGENFFNGNVAEYIKQLPAKIFDRIQIVDDYGDAAAFTGARKGKSVKMLNLVTKPGMNKGRFGNGELSAGSYSQLGANIQGNYWRDSRQVSLNSRLNSIKNSIGINNNNNLGLTVNDKLSKTMKFSSTYSYNNTRASSQNKSFQTTSNNLGEIQNDIANVSNSNSAAHTFNTSLSYRPGQNFYGKSNISIDKSTSDSHVDYTSLQRGVINQNLTSMSDNGNKSPGVNADLMMGYRFKNPGRALTAFVEIRTRNSTTSQNIETNIGYLNNGQNIKDSLLRREVSNLNETQNYGLKLGYVEPLTSKSRLNVELELNRNVQKQNFSTSNLINGLLRPIDSLTEETQSRYQTQRVDVSYMYNIPRVSILQGVQVQRNSNIATFRQDPDGIKNTVINYSPITRITYNFSESSNLDLNYSGSSNAPTINQLQPVQDYRNPQNIIQGNPDLKPSFSHDWEVKYRHYGKKLRQVLAFGMAGKITTNQIVSNISLIADTLTSLKQITTFLNANGSHTYSGNYDWTIPFKLRKIEMRGTIMGNISLSQNVFFDNDRKAASSIKNLSQGAKLSALAKKTTIDATILYTYSYNNYNTLNSPSFTLRTLELMMNSNVILFKKVTYAMQVSKKFNSGYSSIGNVNPLIINASLEKQAFKKLPVYAGLRVADLLNQANRQSRNVYANSVVDNRSEYVSRFFTLTIGYRFSKFN